MELRKILVKAFEEGLISEEVLQKINLLAQTCGEEELIGKIIEEAYLSQNQMEALRRKISADTRTIFPQKFTLVKKEEIDYIISVATGIGPSPGIMGPLSDFGNYTIEGELGRGGMGIVYKGLDKKLQRPVALKILLPGRDSNEEQTRRFMQEARAMAQLKHPNIIQIYEVGEEPFPYISMEFIEGGTLSTHIQRGTFKPTEIASIIEKIARAIHGAHSQTPQIVHRDIKPSNIFIDSSREPKIADFGLAKVMDSSWSKSGGVIGTPAYMPPEQAGGTAVDPRSDVYSMGATLYEGLTGRPPFQGDTYEKIFFQIFHAEPLWPRQLNPDIPKDLEAICLKCMEKKPARRYGTAEMLAKDLENFSKGIPVQAKAPTRLTYLRKFILRNLPLTISALVLLVTITGGGIFSFVQWQRAELSARRARESREREEKSREEAREKSILAREQEKLAKMEYFARSLLYSANIRLAYQSWKNAEIQRVVDLLKGLKPQSHQKDLRDFEWYFIKKISRAHQQTLKGYSGPIRSLSISKDDRFLASISYEKMGTQSSLRIWDLREKKAVPFPKEIPSKFRVLSFSPRENTLALGGMDTPHLILWDLERKKVTGTFQKLIEQKGGSLLEVQFSPDGKDLALLIQPSSLNGSTGKIKLLPALLTVLDRATARVKLRIPGDFRALAYSPDGKSLATSERGGVVKIWELKTGKAVRTLKKIEGWVSTLTYSPDGTTLVTGGKTMGLWNLPKRSSRGPLQGLPSSIRYMDFSSRNLLAIAGSDNTIRLWDTHSLKERAILRGHRGTVTALAFSRNGEFLITGSEDRRVKIWDIKKILTSPDLRGSSFLLSKDGETLVTWTERGSKEKGASVWSLKTGKRIRTFSGESIFAAAFYKGDSQLILAAREGLNLWDLASGKRVKFLCPTPRPPRKIVVTPDGKSLLVCFPDQSIGVLNTHTWQRKFLLKGVRYGGMTPDGRGLITQGDSLQLWDFSTGALMTTLKEGHQFLALSPDGEKILAKGEKGVTCYNLSTEKELFTLEVPEKEILCGAFSPQGKTLATGSKKGTLDLWNAAKLFTPWEGPGEMREIAFDPQGKSLIVLLWHWGRKIIKVF